MALESATYINGLNAANPPPTDGLAEADDHLRLIKSTLLSTFPNLTGAVTVTQADLNGTSGIAALIAGKVAKAGDTMTGALTVTGADVTAVNLNAATGKLKEAGNPLLPQGVIVLWSGSAAAIPAGWGLCDGLVHSGVTTPDLRDRFLVGAGLTYAVGATGGSVNTPTATTGLAGAHVHTATSTSDGSHSHTGATAGYALTVTDIPAHTHAVTAWEGSILTPGTPGAGNTTGASTSWNTGSTGGGAAHSHGISADGLHAHTITVATNTDHTHTIPAVENRPPYYALCYIMKL